MSNYPAMSDTTYRRIFMIDDEWSAAANAAWDTIDALNCFKGDIDWLAGAMAEKTSKAIADRWSYLQSWCAAIRKPGDKYSPALMKGIEAKLSKELAYIDETNLDSDPDDREHSIEQLKYVVGEYAEVIISALKDEMRTDAWGDSIEANQFENNR